MGCVETKPMESKEVEDPCRRLIQLIFEKIRASRNNLKYLEPTYYFLNIILEQTNRKKKVSKVICDELKNFQLNLPPILQEKNINEANFLKYVLPIQAAFNTLYPEIAYDFQSKIKATEGISTTYIKDDEILQDFFLNEPIQFWIKNFGKKPANSWSGFYERFTPVYMNIFEKDLESLPEEKKTKLDGIKENIKLMLRYELESNNDLTVKREAWNAFSFKVLFNFDTRRKFIETASEVPEPKSINNSLLFNLIYLDGRLLDKKDQILYEVSEKGVENNGQGNAVKKNMQSERIKAGRMAENDIIFKMKGDEGQGISRKHFLISLKKNLKEGQIKNEFYISNISSSFIFFSVEAEGYLLAKNMIINLSDNKQFAIREMYPPFKKIPEYLSVEPEYLEAKRELPFNQFGDLTPFIEIEFLDDHYRKNFKVAKDDEDLTFTIGSGQHDSVKVYDKSDDDEETIYPDHCLIKYDGANKCWVVQDKTIVQQGNKTVFKTNVVCYNDGQFEDVGDMQGVEMRGIKLTERMKIFLGNCVLNVEEK